jgi:hypothetical protein
MMARLERLSVGWRSFRSPGILAGMLEPHFDEAPAVAEEMIGR